MLRWQGFAGGNDPNNREPLWPTNFAQSGDLFTFLKTVIAFRKSAAVWEEAQVQPRPSRLQLFSRRYLTHHVTLAWHGVVVVLSRQVQRYSDDSFYAFTRGTTFVALTNVGSNGSSQQRTITYHPYADGTKLCNLCVGALLRCCSHCILSWLCLFACVAMVVVVLAYVVVAVLVLACVRVCVVIVVAVCGFVSMCVCNRRSLALS